MREKQEREKERERERKREREESRRTNASPRVFRTFCMWFLDEAAVKTEPRDSEAKRKAASEIRPPSLAVDTRCPFVDILPSANSSRVQSHFDKVPSRRP